MKLAGVVTAIILLLFSGCYTVPVTGRQSFILIDEGTEMKMGFQAFEKIKSETKISDDPQINAMVNRVGTRVAQVTGRKDYEWEFVVFDEPDVKNAFALPGGKVGVFTGILDITENEAGLAVVMSHEVAHAMAKHGAERYTEGILLIAGAVAVNEAARKSDDRDAFLAAYGIGASLFVALPHSRKQEAEADHIGLVYMARAGYDPREGPRLWRRFARYKSEQGGGGPEFLSTHPTEETRIANMEALMPDVLPYYYEASGQTDKLVDYRQTQTQPAPQKMHSSRIKTGKIGPTAKTHMFKAAPIKRRYILQCPVCGRNNEIDSSEGYTPGSSVKCYNCGSSFK